MIAQPSSACDFFGLNRLAEILFVTPAASKEFGVYGAWINTSDANIGASCLILKVFGKASNCPFARIIDATIDQVFLNRHEKRYS